MSDVLIPELVTTEDMPGVRKAAVLLMTLGTEQAAAMLRRLSGRTHRVLTAVSLVSASREAQVVSNSEVRFGDLDRRTIDFIALLIRIVQVVWGPLVSIGPFLALLALWSVARYVTALGRAINRAYGVLEGRGRAGTFVRATATGAAGHAVGRRLRPIALDPAAVAANTTSCASTPTMKPWETSVR